MLIRFMGPGHRRRLWGEYEFSRAAGFVQWVGAADAAEMLTHPGDEFEVASEEPLLRLEGVGQIRAGLMALAGVGSVEELVGLDAEGRKALARELRMPQKMVGDWIEAAQEMVDGGEAEIEISAELEGYAGCCG